MTAGLSRRSFLGALGLIATPRITIGNPVTSLASDLESEGWTVRVDSDRYPELEAESDGSEGALMERFAVNFAPYARYGVIRRPVTMLVLDDGNPDYLATADPSKEWPANRNRATLWMLEREHAKTAEKTEQERA
jgi:hypothetical protein